MMGVASWLIFRQGWENQAVKAALIAYGIQLLLNAAWSPVFFGLRSPAIGLGVIVALWVAIAVTIYLFSRVSTGATALMVPYLAWVSYATALNFEIWRMN